MNTKISFFTVFFILVAFGMTIQSIYDNRYIYTFLFGFLGIALVYLEIERLHSV